MPIINLNPFRRKAAPQYTIQPVQGPANTPPIYSPYTPMQTPQQNLIGPNVVAQLDSGTIENIVIPAMYAAWSQWGYQPSMPWYQLVNMYTSWVQAVIDKKARTIAMLPLREYQYRGTGGKKVKASSIKHRLKAIESKADRRRWLKAQSVERVEMLDSKVLDLFDHPNPVQTYFSLMHKLSTIYCLAGAVGIYKVKDAWGIPQRLILLPQTWSGEFKAMPDISGGDIIGGYRYQDGDLKQYFSIDEIVWPHIESLKSPFEGMSPLKSQLSAYRLDQQALNQQTSFFSNNAMPGLVLQSTVGALSKEQKTELQQSLVNRAGTQNAGRGMLLPYGLQTIKDTNSHTSRDSMIDLIWKDARDRIASSYDVSTGKMGLTEKQNKANLDTVNENFIAEAIKPDCTLLCQFFNQFLLPDFGEDDRELDFEMPKFMERAQDLAEEQSRIDRGQITINEWRTDNDIDAVEWGDKPWYPMNLIQPGEEPPAGDTGAASSGDTGKPSAEDGTPAKPKVPPEPAKSLTKTKNPWTTERKAAAWNQFAAMHKGYEPMFRKVAQEHFRDQSERIIKAVESKGAKVKGLIANTAKKDLPSYFKEHKDAFASININIDSESEKLYKKLKPAYVEAMTGAAKTRIQSMSSWASIDFNMADERVLKWLGDRVVNCEGIEETTQADIAGILKADYEAGEPLHKISEDIRDYFTKAEGYRADTIARTEATAACNKADLESVKQMGLEDTLVKVWLNEPDARDTHVQAGEDYAEGIPLDEDFSVGSDSMDAPGNGSDPAEVCNCRCTLIYKEKDK